MSVNLLSKLVLNGTEMLIKDATARTSIANAESNITELGNKINRIWNGDDSETHYYVNPSTGSDGLDADGSGEHPFKTIMHAYYVGSYYIAMKTNAFYIHALAGDYYESIQLGSIGFDMKLNLVVHGTVNVHGKITLWGCKCDILREDSGVLHIYYDGTYTTPTYETLSVLNIIENSSCFANLPIYLHCGSGVSTHGMRVDYCSRFSCGNTVDFTGSVGSALIVNMSECYASFSLSGLTTTLATFEVSAGSLYCKNNSSGTYTLDSGAIYGTNLTPYTE